MGEYKKLIKDELDELFAGEDAFQQFTLFDSGKLVIDTKKDDLSARHIVMQFKSHEDAEDWLAEHFDEFNPDGGPETLH